VHNTSEEANRVVPNVLVVLGLAFGPRASNGYGFRMCAKTW